MSDFVCYRTEAAAKTVLLDIVKEFDEAPLIYTAYRDQSRRSFTRVVTFVIQTKEGNEALINKIVKYSSENENMIRFIKSDINVQSGNFEIDFLYVEATIAPNLA